MWVVVILGLISVGSLNVKGQSPAMAPAPDSSGTDCMTLVYTMADCLTYVENGSKLAKPDKACCPEVAGVLKANPICLCEMLSKSKDFSLDLDLNRTLHLPSICKLQTPDVSLCSGTLSNLLLSTQYSLSISLLFKNLQGLIRCDFMLSGIGNVD